MKRGAALIAFAALGALAACGAKKTERHAEARTPTCPPMPARDYVWIPGATFTMGADATLPEEAPAREVTVKGFWMATHEVTNAEFAEFVKATGYKPLAEKDPPKLPGAPPDMLIPGSAVFTAPTDGNPNWWRWVVGAEWRHPEGPKTGIAGRDRSQTHARETGRALTAMDPDYVGALSLMLIPGTPLYADWRAGAFTLISPAEMLAELRTMLAETELSQGLFHANHASNYLPIRARLPKDKAATLRLIDRALAGEVALTPEFMRAL